MREYAKVVPKMWHGKTMKGLRKHPEALIVAMYLITSPSSNARPSPSCGVKPPNWWPA